MDFILEIYTNIWSPNSNSIKMRQKLKALHMTTQYFKVSISASTIREVRQRKKAEEQLRVYASQGGTEMRPAVR